MSGTPARHYSWPPFAPGNQVALRHGAKSARHVEPLAAEIAEQAATVPYLSDPAYGPAIAAWASAEASCLLMRRWFAEHGGLLDERGRPRPGVETLRRFESLAATLRQRLGLDPLSRASLGRDVAAAGTDLTAAALAEGRVIREARERELGDSKQ